ncbi:hypothetical protein ACJQWK_01280 [Exserohilum turcicum]
MLWPRTKHHTAINGSSTQKQTTMFGTLVCDLQHEPLTFVENTDPASALSRNRRDKPHASCELCRARKIRCSGQRSGCDRCIAMSVECKYRDRTGRRKRQASNDGTRSAASSSTTPVPDTKQQDEIPPLAPPLATAEANAREDGAKGGLGDWQMDTDDLLESMLSTQLGTPTNSADMTAEIAWNSILGEDHSTLGPESVDFTTSTSSIASPSSFAQLMAPPVDLQSALAMSEKLQLEAQQPDALNSSLLQPPTATFGDDGRCLCRTFTATLFEELCAESANSSHVPIDVLLRYFRGALSHCTTILDCDRCSASASDSNSNMLLVMAGQYMSTICERIAVCYANIRRRGEERHRSISAPLDWGADMEFGHGSGWDPSGDGVVTDGDMWFSTYRIESSEERMLVLRCLVSVQLAEFARLLERLKSRAGSRSVCLVLLTDAERRMGSAKSILMDSASPSATKSF